MLRSSAFLFIVLALRAHAGPPPHAPVAPLAGTRVADGGPAGLECSTILEAVPDLFDPKSKMPGDIGAWVDRLGQFGETNAIHVPFSRAPGVTSLAAPRFLMTINGDVQNANITQDADLKGKRDLRGQLFVAITIAPDGSQNAEFISWNRKKRAFDFGIIENYNRPEKRRIVAGDAKKRECLSCHKTGSPLFTDFPWSGTMVDPLIAAATLKALHAQDPKNHEKAFKAVFGQDGKLTGTVTDARLAEKAAGATIFVDGKDTKVPIFDGPSVNRTGVFDGNVRDAAELLRANNVLLGVPTEPRTRINRALISEALAKLYDERMPLAKNEKAYLGILRDPAAVETKEAKRLLATAPNGPPLPSTGSTFLLDYDQVKDTAAFRLEPSDENVSHIDRILAFDKERQKHGLILPPGFRASNAEAFKLRTAKETMPLQSAREAALKLAFPKEMRFTSGDIELLDKIFTSATGVPPVERFDPPRGAEREKFIAALRTYLGLIKEALDDKSLAHVFEGGVPNRETFIKPFVTALIAAAQKHKLPVKIDEQALAELPEPQPCDLGPRLGDAPRLTGDAAKRACANCHVGDDKTGIVHFDFDPEDRAAWKTALADPKRREATLRRLRRVIRRLADGDMPPDDSDEADYAKKHPEKVKELAALREYLEGLAKAP